MFVIVTIAFFLIRLAPGGPFDLERPLDAADHGEPRTASISFDEPLWRQYLIYLGNLLQGDLGPSFTRRDFTVAELFATGLPVSIRIGAIALLARAHRRRRARRLRRASPEHARRLRRHRHRHRRASPSRPSSSRRCSAPLRRLTRLAAGRRLGRRRVRRNMILPVLTLGLPQIAIVAPPDARRHDRGAALEPHPHRCAPMACLRLSCRAARAARRGAAGRVLSRARGGLACSTGSLVVETIFGLPGVGRYFVEGALNRDYTLVMGTVVLIAVFVLALQSDRRHPLRVARPARALRLRPPWRSQAKPDARLPIRASSGRSLWEDALAPAAPPTAPPMASLFVLVFMTLASVCRAVAHAAIPTTASIRDYVTRRRRVSRPIRRPIRSSCAMRTPRAAAARHRRRGDGIEGARPSPRR